MFKDISKTSLKALPYGTALAAMMVFGAGYSLPASAEVAASLQQHGGGHDSGSTDDHDHTDTDHGSDHETQGQRGKKGDAPGTRGQGGRRGGLEDIFRDVTGTDTGDDDSDKPAWAGGKGGSADRGGKPDTAGKQGDLFGDMYVILRDINGVPILSEEGFVQPIDADGNLIPLDEEGAPIDPELAIEVELGRLNVGRAPPQVLDRRAQEVIILLNEATAIETDAAGRLVLTVDGEAKTIDSPLENLAIYIALMTTGTIPGVDDLPGTEFDYLVDGELTAADVLAAASFAAAATDKTGQFSIDEIAYLNAFLDINIERVGDVSYSNFDFSDFTYDRSDMYEGVTVEVLIQQPDGTWAPTTINVYEVIFGGVDFTGGGSISAFSQAADDARKIINFIHEYAIPADSTD